ncbi:LytR/AlgR family response regulator transcription factor [Parabacteroides bouchesdurhonensis]|uniref:LytR/AlgR family response regulator transcription factor n=1 Tax=Parabacteroides bouchesdurhonensis TaxID=1936995 RepID=UPI000C8659DF|nr:LytTR family DNA-binding domain-containing protein [Parabacteroides bouchesdurhonensis]
MNCIIVDDEPLAREAVEMLINDNGGLTLAGSFNSATSAARFIKEHPVDLIFLDIRMPKVTGLEFARTIPKSTLVIFTTAYAQYAIDSYEVDAVDYLVKPIIPERFRKAIEKAEAYHALLLSAEKDDIEEAAGEFMFVKSERRFFKVVFNDILFIEGLKDYVIIQLPDQRIITKTSMKAIHELLPKAFLRINRSYIVNTQHIASFDSNDIYIDKYEIAIGSNYRDTFFEEFVLSLRHGKE